MLSKNCIFDLINNLALKSQRSQGLWFAFKKLYLWSDKQQNSKIVYCMLSCDLLSKNCIFDLINNGVAPRSIGEVLWFAFKKLYLWSDKQLLKPKYRDVLSCDLLSKNCIFDLINNFWTYQKLSHVVVICFQKIVSLIW